MKQIFALTSVCVLVLLAGSAHTFAETPTQTAQIGTPVAAFVNRLRVEQASRRDAFIQKTVIVESNTETITIKHVRRSKNSTLGTSAIIAQFDGATNRLYTIADKLQKQVTIVAQRELDITRTQTQLDRAFAFLEETENSIARAETILNTSASDIGASLAAHPHLTSAQQYLMTAHQNLVQVVESLRIALAQESSNK